MNTGYVWGRKMKAGKQSRKNRIWRMLVLTGFLGTALLAGGCGQSPEEGSGLIVIEQEADPIIYDMAAVTVGDVQKTQRIKCTYQQLNEESLSFGISGKSVDKVYVQEGDAVERGQVLAELSSGSRQEDIARLEYQIARNQLQLEYSQINEDYEISSL